MHFRSLSKLVLLGGAAAFGCVLVVDPAKDLSGTCHFAGESATCGSCIVSSCRGFVDQCCGDGLCRGTVTDLDTCAQSGGASCRAIAYPTLGSPASDALASCILQQCDKACGSVTAVGPPGETAATSTSCVVPSDGKQCRCTVPSSTGSTTTPNAETCSPLTVPNAVCCADLDWPLAGTDCECRTVTCATSNGGAGCTCSTFASGPLSSCSTGGGCCQGSSGGCECGQNPNICTLAPAGTAGFKSVPACGPATVGCGSMKKRILGRCSAQ